MARKYTDWPRQGKIKRTGQGCIITGESNIAGISCYRVKFSPKGKETDWGQDSVIVLGRYGDR